MFYYLSIMTFMFLLVKPSCAGDVPLSLKTAIKSESIQKSIMETPYARAHFSETTFEKQKGQAMDFIAAGLHEKSCNVALKKLSLYENYKKDLSLLEESSYNNENKIVNFLISSPILPIKMGLRFKIDRIEKVGIYPFVFQEGFLQNLKGEVHISEENKRCFIYIKADWVGPTTHYNNSLLEFFSETVVKLGMEKLFRISK